MAAFAILNSGPPDVGPLDREPLELEIVNRHGLLTVDHELVRRAVERVLAAERVVSAELSLVLTHDAEIHRINREYLGHDYPTDVISFSLAPDGEAVASSHQVQGELIVSLDTARQVASAQGWSLQAEVILYVVHGLLHLCGYDDETDETRVIMRQREREILSGLGLPRGGDPTASGWNQADS